MQIFFVYDDYIDFREREDVTNILRLQPIINRYINRSGSRNPKNAFQESRGVGCQDPDALEAVLEQEVSEPASPVCEFGVSTSQEGSVGRYVDDGLGVWFYLSGSREKRGWRKRMDVMSVRVFCGVCYGG